MQFQLVRPLMPGSARGVDGGPRHPGIAGSPEMPRLRPLEVYQGTVGDVAETNQNRLEAEVMLMKAKEAKPSPDVAVLERRLSEVERKLDQILKSQPEKRPAP